MSMTITLPQFDLPACAWKTTKVAVGVVVFVAMSLPVAFPAKVANSAVPVASMIAPQPSAPAKVQTQAPAKAKATAPAKVEAAQVPNKKPLPKNA